MRKATGHESRVCRLHDLVVRDATGHSRAFRFGEIVELTPALTDALGEYLAGFAPIAASTDTDPVVGEAETVISIKE